MTMCRVAEKEERINEMRQNGWEGIGVVHIDTANAFGYIQCTEYSKSPFNRHLSIKTDTSLRWTPLRDGHLSKTDISLRQTSL